MVVQCKSVVFLQPTAPQKLAVAQNEANLRHAGLWDYLSKDWDDKLGLRNPLPTVTQFVASSEYCTGNEGRVGDTTIRFTTKEISELMDIPEGRLLLSQLEELSPEVTTQIFGEVKRGKEGWNGTKAASVMSGWLPFISQRLFFNMDEKKIEDKQISAAWMAWNGIKINWSEILIVSIRREISRKKTRNPMFLLSSGYLNVLCKDALDMENPGINLMAVPLGSKEPEDKTNSLGRKNKTNSSSSSNSTPSTRSKLKLVEVKGEVESLVNPVHMDIVGSLGTKWTVSSRDKKRPRDRNPEDMDLGNEVSEENLGIGEEDNEEEEEDSDSQNKEDELSRKLQMKEQENSVLKKEVDNLKVSQNEASQRKKGISMQLQKELKQNAHLIDNNNSLQEQLKQ
jgi:hypothetical protein